ncbi:uncharacterized protein LOC106162509 [Lingula anatina]|uniref:MICOS complex subunit n=1 Tax=Lingula anatina TaxID=7574 RepID=A0A1S3IAI4_LINAN|nr:uncharacterized protein LOC106162509 [Lingula anatina]|eukprot:XP_013395272.1 uncharacterized protein LOC106162509 [Lingula anatina]
MAKYKLLIGGGLGTALVGGITLYGQTLTEKQEKRTTVLKPDQLAFYEVGASGKEYYIEETITPVTKFLKSTRLSIRSALEPFKDKDGVSIIEKISDKWGIARAHTEDLIEQIRSDPEVKANAGMIAVAGVVGASLGYRGGVLRKAAFGTTAMVVTASLLYPERAVSVGIAAVDRITGKGNEVKKSEEEMDISEQVSTELTLEETTGSATETETPFSSSDQLDSQSDQPASKSDQKEQDS